MDHSLSALSLPSSSSSSPSSSSLILFTCFGSVIAFGSVIIFIRRVFNPHTTNNSDENTTTTNNNSDENTTTTTNNSNNVIALQRLDINLRLGFNRFRVDLNLLFTARHRLENANRRRFDLNIRIGGNYPHEIVVLLFLLLLRSQAAPILLPILEDVEFAAVSYLGALRRPRIACRIV